MVWPALVVHPSDGATCRALGQSEGALEQAWGERRGKQRSESKRAEGNRGGGREVLGTFGHSIFHEVAQHENTGNLFLPHHGPKISSGFLQWALCSDKPPSLFRQQRSLLVPHRNIAGIDIAIGQSHSRVVICLTLTRKYIDIAVFGLECRSIGDEVSLMVCRAGDGFQDFVLLVHGSSQWRAEGKGRTGSLALHPHRVGL